MLDKDALLAEWVAMAAARKMDPDVVFLARQAKDGSPVYIAKCANGVHESVDSPEQALFLLVDSFRTRVEDLPETHARVQAWGGSYAADVQVARDAVAEIAWKVAKENPALSGEERDALVLAALDTEEQAQAEAALVVVQPVTERIIF